MLFTGKKILILHKYLQLFTQDSPLEVMFDKIKALSKFVDTMHARSLSIESTLIENGSLCVTQSFDIFCVG